MRIAQDATEKIIKEHKNRKTPSSDEIYNELIKYGGKGLTTQLTILFQKIIAELYQTIEKKALSYQHLKRGQRNNPGQEATTEESHYSAQ